MVIPLSDDIEMEPGVMAMALAKFVDLNCQINAKRDAVLIGSFYRNQIAIFESLMQNVVPSMSNMNKKQLQLI